MFLIKSIKYIPIIFCNEKQAIQVLQRHIKCITEPYHDYIIDKMFRQYQIEYEINNYIKDTDDYCLCINN